MKADADLITAGLLLDLKTDSKSSLGVMALFQIIGYALLDFEDAYHTMEVGIFSARYAHLATWNLVTLIELIEELAGHPVCLPAVRQQFGELLGRR